MSTAHAPDATESAAANRRVHRVEVRPKANAGDPRGHDLLKRAASIGHAPTAARSARVYLIEGDLTDDQLDRVIAVLLANPVTETAEIGSADPIGVSVEVHPLPGVMDPPAQTVRDAIEELVGVDTRVTTGWRYDLEGVTPDQARAIAERLLANPVVAGVHTEPFHPSELPTGHAYEFNLRHIPIRDLDDAALEKLSRDAHLFLDLNEMRAIRDEYNTLGREPTDIELETLAQTWSEHCVHKTLKATINYKSDDPSDPVLKPGRPGHQTNADGSVTIHNLLKSSVAAATFELIDEGLDWTLSVFVDNAGIVKFDENNAVCVKVETHNHPSAIEPYGGAATGIGGCIRDIIGTGLAAKPIANTDVFCVAMPDTDTVPAGCLHPKRILTEVVAGVRDYGNRMGIPTVNGAVWFDDRHIGNPLVFAGSIGVMPNHLISGEAQPGDLIVALGGRTGRDGIHGATFSSAELTDTHADEFSHAVQIGNAIEEKRVLDAIMRARDWKPTIDRLVADQMSELGVAEFAALGEIHLNPSGFRTLIGTGDRKLFAVDPTDEAAPQDITDFIGVHAKSFAMVQRFADGASIKSLNLGSPLFSAITDCGAGGFSSAVGEMGEKIGADVHLEKAPLKYDGLSYTEIWISEAQERMVMAVPRANLAALQAICEEEHVELSVLGTFGTDNQDLILNYHGTEVGRLPMSFLHDGIPMPTREAVWTSPSISPDRKGGDGSFPLSPVGERAGVRGSLETTAPTTSEALLKLLAHPNIASKHWIVRQYDHEVQGNLVTKPLVGPQARGPGDASIIEPVPGSGQGLAIGCGLATGLEADPYQMALATIDECVRNLVCVGADPDRIAILDNFCWPSCKKPENLASLVRAAEGCYDGAKAYRTPFVSGKDSLNNQFTTESGETIEIPPTLLITGIAPVADVNRSVTMDAKRAGNTLLMVGTPAESLAASHYSRLFGTDDRTPTSFDPKAGAGVARAVADVISRGLARSAHDVSDGGTLVSLAEMLIAGSMPGSPIGFEGGAPLSSVLAFGECPGVYLIETHSPAEVTERLAGTPCETLGRLTDSGRLRWNGIDESVEDLAAAWRGTLDW